MLDGTTYSKVTNCTIFDDRNVKQMIYSIQESNLANKNMITNNYVNKSIATIGEGTVSSNNIEVN